MTVANRPTDFGFENEQTGFDLSNYKIKMFGRFFVCGWRHRSFVILKIWSRSVFFWSVRDICNAFRADIDEDILGIDGIVGVMALLEVWGTYIDILSDLICTFGMVLNSNAEYAN